VEVLNAVLTIVAGLLIAWSVSLVTNRVLAARQKSAKELNELAGVVSVLSFDVLDHFASLADVLRARPPQRTISMLVVSGRSVFRNPATLLDSLQGIRLRILLLDPNSEEPLLVENPWLAQETRDTLSTIRTWASTHQAEEFEVRLYRGVQLQMLMFVDDDRLFVSSFFPVSSASRIVSEIRPGGKSLYQIYREGFEYVWQRSHDERARNKLA
jgi:hypothetical protein